MIPKRKDLASVLSDIRTDFLRRIYVANLFLVITGLPASLSQVAQIGFKITHAVHIGGALVYLLVFLLRKKITDFILLYSTLAIYVALYSVGFYTMGFLAISLFFY